MLFRWFVCLVLLLWPTVAVAAPQHAQGLVFPEAWTETGTWEEPSPVSTLALPQRWDWNDYGHLQPIRSQKQCGSCWAFATTAVTESLHRLIHPEAGALDLAEQTLVSTCERGGDCGGGFFTAFDYVRQPGLPLERDDPYLARNSQCKPGLRSAAKISRWAYVGAQGRAPTLAQVKAAIHDHGPVAVAVNGEGLQTYTGGVLTRCSSQQLNHMVVVEGWVDDPVYARNGGGYWKVRNSWGTQWGEQGYGRVAYQTTSGTQCLGLAKVAAYAIVDNVENLREHLRIPD